jgi:hypothetical protein
MRKVSTGQPFYITAYAWFLVGVNRGTLQECVKRGTQVGAAEGNIISGPGSIKLPPVNQLEIVVKKIEIRGAGSLEGTGNLLGFIIQIGKGVTFPAGGFLHKVRGILGVIFHIVTRYCYECNPFTAIVIGQFNQFRVYMFHKRAMVADEHNQGALFTPKGL